MSQPLVNLLSKALDLARAIAEKDTGVPISRRLEELSTHEYLTNDLVELNGRIGSECYIRINGTKPIQLCKGDFIIMSLLIYHGMEVHEQTAPRRVPSTKFLSVEDIINAVDTWRTEERLLSSFWMEITKAGVHRAVYDLRMKLHVRFKVHPMLIETGPIGSGGYRLSTSPFNVVIA